MKVNVRCCVYYDYDVEIPDGTTEIDDDIFTTIDVEDPYLHDLCKTLGTAYIQGDIISITDETGECLWVDS